MLALRQCPPGVTASFAQNLGLAVEHLSAYRQAYEANGEAGAAFKLVNLALAKYSLLEFTATVPFFTHSHVRPPLRSMPLNAFGISSSVFLALYAILFGYLVVNYATRRFALRSRWTLLMFHVSVRLAAQAVGLAFACIGYSATGLLVASLALSQRASLRSSCASFASFACWPAGSVDTRPNIARGSSGKRHRPTGVYCAESWRA